MVASTDRVEAPEMAFIASSRISTYAGSSRGTKGSRRWAMALPLTERLNVPAARSTFQIQMSGHNPRSSHSVSLRIPGRYTGIDSFSSLSVSAMNCFAVSRGPCPGSASGFFFLKNPNMVLSLFITNWRENHCLTERINQSVTDLSADSR